MGKTREVASDIKCLLQVYCIIYSNFNNYTPVKDIFYGKKRVCAPLDSPTIVLHFYHNFFRYSMLLNRISLKDEDNKELNLTPEDSHKLPSITDVDVSIHSHILLFS